MIFRKNGPNNTPSSEKVSGPTTVPAQQLRSRLFISIFLLLAVALIVTGWLWYSHNNMNLEAPKGSYSNQRTAVLLLQGTGKGDGLTIAKPNVMSIPLKGIPNDKSALTLAYLKTSNPQKKEVVIYGFLSLKSHKYPSAFLATTKYKDYVKAQLDNPSGQDYQSAIGPTQTFASQTGIYGEKVTLDAGQFDASAVDIGHKNPDLKGKVLYILGDNAWYYVMVMADKNSWQNNQTFFDNVLKSALVDQ
jgi:hypothetical protein